MHLDFQWPLFWMDLLWAGSCPPKWKTIMLHLFLHNVYIYMCKYYMYCILFHDVYIYIHLYDMICVICTVHLKITLIWSRSYMFIIYFYTQPTLIPEQFHSFLLQSFAIISPRSCQIGSPLQAFRTAERNRDSTWMQVGRPSISPHIPIVSCVSDNTRRVLMCFLMRDWISDWRIYCNFHGLLSHTIWSCLYSNCISN